MSGARQIVPLRDGSLWIRDLTGRHLRSVTPDGIIHTINPNFETSANIMMLGDGTPGAAVSTVKLSALLRTLVLPAASVAVAL